RGLRRGLEHHRASAGERRPRFARDHRVWKVPGGYRRDHAYRLLDDEQTLVGLMSGNDVAINPPGFLGEPFDETGAISDFTLGLGQRLALLQRKYATQIVLIGHYEVVPAPQNACTVLCRRGRPLFGPDAPPRWPQAS